ncbi:3-dehydroquinate synthase [Fibrella aestuarina BUZ 2]|uniref:3-dehydroquinate synthase n=1 Tax=Fibrella aestuarina BUZ 2 TaxID=1166018 RepID=I0K7C0_9BACT|nr:3-dehydroquinate synthase [Fibrella aestuarina]CCH00023.1 3-dehydroquinate synthase [Fibrella aestuarina BUZ 2]
MNQLEQSFSVPFTYTVSFTEHLFASDNTLFRDWLTQSARRSGTQLTRKLLFVIDSGVLAAHPTLPANIQTYFADVPGLRVVDEPMVVPGGELAKNSPELVDQLIDAVDRYGIDRHSYIAAIGGGAVLDLVGYAAAIAHRGVRHIRIPTTVLSQNDSGVGVKNGVNWGGKKNFVGTFAPPVAVFNDAAFLGTLDDRDWRSGISEAIKVALIKDRPFFEWLDTNADALANRDAEAMSYLVYRCAQLHMQHIAGGDPFEMGSARPLDFGHWAAHKLEYLTDFSVRHGEAVAIGIALDTVYSQLAGRITATDADRVLSVLQRLGFDLFHPALAENGGENLRRGLTEFQEHLGGELTITLLDALGQGVEVHEMDTALIQQAIEKLENTLMHNAH